MSEHDTGGPAFSRPASIGNNYITGESGVIVDPQKGMDLRDYFAASAMQGHLSNAVASQAMSCDVQNGGRAGLPSQRSFCEEVAKSAYEFADAMLAARKAVAR